MTIKTMTLVKIAAIGGFATAIMGYIAQTKIQNNVKSALFYKEAIKLVRSHPGAVKLLGEPIKVGYIDVGKSSKNYVEQNRAQFEVPLKGANERGVMYLSASKEDEDKEWSLSRIELQFAKYPDKRLVIMSKG